MISGVRFQPMHGGPAVTLRDDGRIDVDGMGVITRTWNTHVDDWKDLITESASRWDIPEAWIAGVMMQESGGQQKALSSAGCVGLMQICDPIVPISKEDLWEPENNIDMGARILAAHAAKAHWNPVHVAVMYNAGGVYPFSGSASSCSHDGLWHLRENCGYAEQVVRGINTAIELGYSGTGATETESGQSLSGVKVVTAVATFAVGIGLLMKLGWMPTPAFARRSLHGVG